MLRAHVVLVPTTLVALLATSRAARAEGTTLRADLVEPKSVKLDGVPKEWTSFVDLTYAVKGKASPADLGARAGVAYDATYVYVGAEVTDDVLRGGGTGDRVELVLGFPGGVVHKVVVYPGDPGKSSGVAKTSEGKVIAGANVVEAPRAGGWSVEAAIPWATFPAAKQVRVGLRGAVFVHDVDRGSTLKSVLGSAPSATYASLPPVNTEAEQSLYEGLLKTKGLRGAPRWDLLADVAGDAMKERVLVFERYLVVLGANFRNGREYTFTDLGVAPENLLGCEVREMTGDGLGDIVLKKRLVTGTTRRTLLQVQSFGSKEALTPIFQHEIGIANEQGSVQNEVAYLPDGGRTAIQITPGMARGLNAGNYHEPTETAWDPLLLPWGTVASQRYTFVDGMFKKASEETQSAAPPPAAPGALEPSLPKPPPPPSPEEQMEKVYAAYQQERGMAGRPRFDLATDVAEDRTPERVLLHDRDLVVFGKGYKGGTGYAYLTLQQFASPSDILEMTARDVTGDGKAEVMLKGVLHAKGPTGDVVDREILLVFQVAPEGLRRVFAAEIGRATGTKRVRGSVRFSNNTIELGPGTAVEWTAANYPFTQDTGPSGGLEPLILPWGGATAVRYTWGGNGFRR